ncbi:MAG: YXWGXW repeat-containing protein [Limisphaerales bacterium]
MKKSVLVKSLLVAASLPLFAGCVEREAVQPGAEAVVQQPAEAPPLQAEVVPPQPDITYVWVPGSWDWRSGQWLWVAGRWTPPPHPGAVWVHGRWHKHHRGYVWIHGHWQ